MALIFLFFSLCREDGGTPGDRSYNSPSHQRLPEGSLGGTESLTIPFLPLKADLVPGRCAGFLH